jgi:hypothetical protein
MSRGVEPVLITKQEIMVLPIIEPTLAQGVPMDVRVRYSEPKFH